MSEFNIPYGFRPLNPIHLDTRFGPYHTISEALEATEGVRVAGLKIGIIEDNKVNTYVVQPNTSIIERDIGVSGWGSIIGDIEDQSDLVDFVSKNSFSDDRIGNNLNLDNDGKLNLGIDNTAASSNSIVISNKGTPFNISNPSTYPGSFLNLSENSFSLLSTFERQGSVQTAGLSTSSGGTLRVVGSDSFLEISDRVKVGTHVEYIDGMPNLPNDNTLTTVKYVKENSFGIDRVGKNLNLGEDGKLNVGVEVDNDPSPLTTIHLTNDGTSFNLADPNTYPDSFITLSKDLGASLNKVIRDEQGVVFGAAGISINPLGDIFLSTLGGQDLKLEVLGGRILQNVGETGDIDISTSPYSPPLQVPGEIRVRAQEDLKLSAKSGDTYVNLTDKVTISPYAEYEYGMPTEPSDNTLTTVEYVRENGRLPELGDNLKYSKDGKIMLGSPSVGNDEAFYISNDGTYYSNGASLSLSRIGATFISNGSLFIGVGAYPLITSGNPSSGQPTLTLHGRLLAANQNHIEGLTDDAVATIKYVKDSIKDVILGRNLYYGDDEEINLGIRAEGLESDTIITRTGDWSGDLNESAIIIGESLTLKSEGQYGSVGMLTITPDSSELLGTKGSVSLTGDGAYLNSFDNGSVGLLPTSRVTEGLFGKVLNNQVIFSFRTNGANLKTYAEYESGMPDNPTDNMLATVKYVDDSIVDPELGGNLYYSEDGKINLGVDLGGLPDTVAITSDGTLSATTNAYLLMSGAGGVELNSGDNPLALNTTNDFIVQAAGVGAGSIQMVAGVGGVNILSVNNGTTALGAGSIDITLNPTTQELLLSNRSGASTTDGSITFRLGTGTSGLSLLKDEGNDFKFLFRGGSISQTYAEYELGMPANPTDNVLPTIGYVKGMVGNGLKVESDGTIGLPGIGGTGNGPAKGFVEISPTGPIVRIGYTLPVGDGAYHRGYFRLDPSGIVYDNTPPPGSSIIGGITYTNEPTEPPRATTVVWKGLMDQSINSLKDEIITNTLYRNNSTADPSLFRAEKKSIEFEATGLDGSLGISQLYLLYDGVEIGGSGSKARVQLSTTNEENITSVVELKSKYGLHYKSSSPLPITIDSRTFVWKGLMDQEIATLQSTIEALEARIAALEG